MPEYYVFESMYVARECMSFINSDIIFPVVSKNAETGKDEPEKSKTENWGDPEGIPIRATDGKPYFKRIPEKYRESRTEAERIAFTVAFPHTIENYSEDWMMKGGVA